MITITHPEIMTVYIVKYDDTHGEIIGVYESLPDAQMKASEEEAMTNIPCLILPFTIIPATGEYNHLYDPEAAYAFDHRFPESSFPEHTKLALQQKREYKEEMRQRWRAAEEEEIRHHVAEYLSLTPNKHLHTQLVLTLENELYTNVNSKLVDGSITLEIFRQRKNHVDGLTRALIDDIKGTMNGYVNYYLEIYIVSQLKKHGYTYTRT